MDALNQKDEHNVKNIFKEDESYLESDVDEQLIISVPFNQRRLFISYASFIWIEIINPRFLVVVKTLAVKLHSLKFKVPNVANAPKTVKIYANRQVLGFDDADSVKETQVLELTPENFEENGVVNLRFVKYQNITHILVNVPFIQSCYTVSCYLPCSLVVCWG